MSGNKYYTYQGRSGYRRNSGPSDGLFGWTVFMFLLVGFVLLCWMGSYYIFSNPENPRNYRLLKRLRKIESPQRFEITAAPRGEFLKPGMLLEHFGSMTAGEIRRTNENLLRGFVRNYHQSRDLIPYAVGTYRVIASVPLSEKTFCPSGVVALLQAVEQPQVLLEQLFTADARNIPALARSLTPGQEIKLEKPLDLSAVVHVERLPDNRIMLTTMPLLYGTYGAGQGQASFSLAPPEDINIERGLPVLTAGEIEKLSGGKIAKSPATAQGLKRLPEELPPPVAAGSRTKQKEKGKVAAPSGTPAVERAIAVNAPAVLPAVPLNTPVSAVTPPDTAISIPSGNTAVAPEALPATAATRQEQVVPGRPLTPPATALTQQPQTQTPAVPVTAAGATLLRQIPPASSVIGGMTPGVVSGGVNGTLPNPQQPGAVAEIWPVYTPGQMPRGRLVTAAEGNDLAGRGVAGERHYLEGRFAVTAAGNGRAVLRPQGQLAGVPMGPSSRVRVIVEFPAGSALPAEGNVIARDQMRPFQITSVRKGDDGQINIYAREITREQ